MWRARTWARSSRKRDRCPSSRRLSPVPSLCPARGGVSPQLDAVFQKMVAKQAEDRQQSMAAVIAELEACGGAWYNHTSYSRSAYRQTNLPADRHPLLGFRVVAEIAGRRSADARIERSQNKSVRPGVLPSCLTRFTNSRSSAARISWQPQSGLSWGGPSDDSLKDGDSSDSPRPRIRIQATLGDNSVDRIRHGSINRYICIPRFREWVAY